MSNQGSFFGTVIPNRCQIAADAGQLVFTSPYDAHLVADLKSRIPYADRKFDGAKKAWVVAPQHGQELISLARRYFHEELQLPELQAAAEKQELKLLEIRYLGQCKDRGDGIRTAFGYLASGEWAAIFPEEVLRSWFEAGPVQPGQAPTLYGVLGVKADCSPDDLKSAFRRAARTWHPDVNRDPDAAEQFKQINHAYQVLADPKLRGRYDAGLKLEASLGRNKPVTREFACNYRSPLNCGWVMAKGADRLGRFVIEQILGWEDTTRNGLTLCVSWPAGAKKPVESWV